MDKKTIGVVAGCLVLLIGWQWLVNKMYPPQPKARPALATDVAPTNTLPAEAIPTSEAFRPVLLPATEEDGTVRPPEQTAVLQNEYVRIEFTSWGGGIRSVELLEHRAHRGATSNVVLNADGTAPALALRGREQASYTLSQPDGRTIVMRSRDVEKRFTLGDDYSLAVTLAVRDALSAEVVLGMVSLADDHETDDLLGVGWLVDTKYQDRGLKQAKKGPQTEMVAARWAAVKNQFFAMVLSPTTNTVAVRYESVELPRPADGKAKEPPHGLLATVEVPANSITSDQLAHFEFSYYAGPKQFRRLVALGNGQEEVMHFGFFGIISVMLLKSMNFFHGLIPNYGVAIILITICIKIIFWPIQAKSIKSMKEMQKFQPVMAKLKEKYKDDPQKMNAEMMKLYKEHKINPFAGCLPMVVQIPVFFAFYSMLRSAVELRGASFIWMKDLSQADTIAHLAGFPLNPLPLVMGATMIWQMKLTPQTGDSQQQKIMMFMPLIFLFMCYKMASGLVLYWTVQQLLSIAQQWWSLRQPDAPTVTVLPPSGKSK